MGKLWSVKKRVLIPDENSPRYVNGEFANFNGIVKTVVVKSELSFEEAKQLCKETGGNAFIVCDARRDPDPEVVEVENDAN